MGKGKPRTASNRKVNKLISETGKHPIKCVWWDGGYPECDLPWCGKEGHQCQGNPFVCKKLLYRYIGGANNISRVVKTYIEQIERKNK